MKTVVIGAGANELVAAHYLARAGHEVIVLEEHDAPRDEEAVARPPASARTATVAHLRTWHNTTRKAGACAGLFF